MNNEPWERIFSEYEIERRAFDETPYVITAEQIKQATAGFKETHKREVRILCKQDTRASRPEAFVRNGLFILPIKNGKYALVRGEGYVDIPEIKGAKRIYAPKIHFPLHTARVGNSEMQHLDFAYAVSLIRTFLEDDSLVLTIRGRKYTPRFSFRVGRQEIDAESVQTEVDAGYEGRDQVVLVEAKNGRTDNIIIRQLFYPFRQWSQHTSKEVRTLFFEKCGAYYSLWQFGFEDPCNYNSVRLVRSCRYEMAAG